MLVAISGSQSTGKSTLIASLAAEYNIPTIERKTSRSILTDWGVSLSDVNNSRELTIQFQEEIILRKQADEQEAVHSSDVWVTERTYVDLFTYAVVAVGKDNECSDWLNHYYHRCLAAQATYSGVVYLQGGAFAPVHDGVRGTNQHYSRMVDLLMYDYATTHMMCANQKFQIIGFADLTNRVRTAANMINNIQEQHKTTTETV